MVDIQPCDTTLQTRKTYHDKHQMGLCYAKKKLVIRPILPREIRIHISEFLSDEDLFILCASPDAREYPVEPRRMHVDHALIARQRVMPYLNDKPLTINLEMVQYRDIRGERKRKLNRLIKRGEVERIHANLDTDWPQSWNNAILKSWGHNFVTLKARVDYQIPVSQTLVHLELHNRINYMGHLYDVAKLPSSMPALETFYITGSWHSMLDLRGFPQNTPALKVLMLDCNLCSLTGLPKSIASLESLTIVTKKIDTLDGICEDMNNLRSLHIEGPRMHSLGELPRNLPQLREIVLCKLPRLATIHDLPTQLPHLKHIEITQCGAFDIGTGVPRQLRALVNK